MTKNKLKWVYRGEDLNIFFNKEKNTSNTRNPIMTGFTPHHHYMLSG